MRYFGEHLLPGRFGTCCIYVALIASFFSLVAYLISTCGNNPKQKKRWRNAGRVLFFIQALSVAGIFSALFYIISNHLFEYKYAWQHSSRTLEAKYLLACLWEGQEGSFLLWGTWNCLLGLILLKTAKKWESPVMVTVGLMQFCLVTMISGLHVYDLKIGSDPFVLLRDELHAPLFSRADYLSFVKDGNDLNPLLQNYWMVIHPPVLFLGFASCLIPFAYAIAGLSVRKYNGWIDHAMPWALFSLAILGAGIMMGAMWAYESLTFGGYWAWDPVENAALVPWLILVAALHTMVICQRTGSSLRSSHLLVILSFLLILYSTFLTRSGILGDSSVHAFTDMGMSWQLLLFVLVFAVPSTLLLLFRYRKIPSPKKDFHGSSREFWMFIGSMVLCVSAASIILMTSIPVINKTASFFAGKSQVLFKPLVIGDNAEYNYNKVQVFIAILLGLLTAFSQYLKYKKTTLVYAVTRLKWPLVISFVTSVVMLFFVGIHYPHSQKKGKGRVT